MRFALRAAALAGEACGSHAYLVRGEEGEVGAGGGNVGGVNVNGSVGIELCNVRPAGFGSARLRGEHGEEVVSRARFRCPVRSRRFSRHGGASAANWPHRVLLLSTSSCEM